MAEPTIKRGSDHFFVSTYEGNGGGQRVGNFVPFTDNGTIAKSCIFNNGDSPRLNRTPSGTGTSRRKYTISVWAKPSLTSSASDERYMLTAGAYGNDDALAFKSDRTLRFWINGTSTANLITTRTFEDSSKFYHILVAVDTTQSTASDRVKIYVDGDQITSFGTENYPSQDYDGNWGNAASTNIGSSNSPNRYYNGYLAEVNYVDGTALTPSTFGLTDTSTGRWIPKTLTGITYGTNGFRLTFANSAGQTIGDDTSGNGNDLTVTNLAASDITTDSPTQNHATLNQIKNSNITLSEGNLKSATVSGGQGYVSGSNMPLTSGKYYSEITITTAGSTLFFIGVGNYDDYLDHYTAENPANLIAGGYIRSDNGQAYTARSDSAVYHTYGNSFTTNDIMGFAIDVDKGALWISKNGTWQNSATASEIANGDTSNSLTTGMKGPLIILNYTHSGTTLDYNFGQKGFEYTPPTGYNAVQQDNFPETSKDLPDFVWSKSRDNTESHTWYDSSRGATKQISSNNTSAENTQDDGLQKFLKGGYQCEDHTRINQSGISYVSWKWHANGGTTSANTDGSGASIASTIQANQTAGFSIVQWTGTGSAGTIAHGLSKAPEWIIMKNLETATDWPVYHHKNTSAPETDYLSLYQSSATADLDIWNDTAPTNKVITIKGNYNSNGNDSKKMIFYCWHGIEGYSKFGVYTGTGNADGRYVYTGFKPAWIMFKETGNSNNWPIWDNKRFPLNPTNNSLFADLNQADNGSSIDLDVLSNGFKCRTTNSQINRSGGTYVYMAFAEHPFVGNGTNPVTAR